MSKYFRKIRFEKIEQAVFFDIECATIEPELKEGTDLYESWKYKMRHEGLTTFEEYNEKFKTDGPLYSPFLKVVSIVCGYIKDNQLITKDYTGDDEKQLLQDFFTDLWKLTNSGKTHLVSFAGIGYDLPVVAFRAMVHGIDIHPWFDVAHQKEWNLEYCIDLNLYLRGTAFQNLSLLNAAVAFGLPSPKQSMSGDEVSNIYWSKSKKRMEKISDYCTIDVQTLALLLAKIMKIEVKL